jgi:Domain of unknown function (DUF5615)
VRFYLDHNVDARCVQHLSQLGHEAWTTAQARRATATDDEQTVYANHERAVLVTHDREFTARRKALPYGWHVRLVVEEPDGPSLLIEYLDRLIPIIEHNENIAVEVRPEGIRLFFGTEPPA